MSSQSHMPTWTSSFSVEGPVHYQPSHPLTWAASKCLYILSTTEPFWFCYDFWYFKQIPLVRPLSTHSPCGPSPSQCPFSSVDISKICLGQSIPQTRIRETESTWACSPFPLAPMSLCASNAVSFRSRHSLA